MEMRDDGLGHGQYGEYVEAVDMGEVSGGSLEQRFDGTRTGVLTGMSMCR